uniref:Cyclin n=1 Tax=Hanusia phi TaxID=3032 RepID=A0A7S0EQG6_9CRYP|mmetsp:Transcript_28522/g.64686  ORF Transcript_28522/g.64686 Transcript_28522/m.64686 type:complete len:276 (+) Transcript_28522:188-1015(+)
METFLASELNPEEDIIFKIMTQMRGGKVERRISFDAMCKALDKDAEDQEYLVEVVASALESAVEANDKKPHQLDSTSFISSFYGTPPPISAHAYIKRIYKYGGLSPCNLVVALVLIERLYSIMGENKTDKKVYIPLRSTSFQRMYLTAAMISSKFEDGYYYSNAHWAEVAGIPLPELNRLELKFLFGIAFQVQVHRETYNMWCRSLTETVSGDGTQLRSQGMNRNLMRAAAKWSASKPKGYRPWRAKQASSTQDEPKGLQHENSWEGGSEASVED